MLNKAISLQVLVAIFAIGFLTQCNAQEKANPSEVKVASTGATMARPADEAIVEIVIPDYELKEATLEHLQSLPIPDFKLIFKSQDNFKTELPADVKNILEIHWKEAIKFFYSRRFNKPLTAQDGYKRDVVWTNYCQRIEEKLQKLFIAAPNGDRQISLTEADDLYGGLNQAAVNIIDKAEKIK